MEISGETHAGQTITVYVDVSDVVDDANARIESLVEIPAPQERFSFAHKATARWPYAFGL